MCRKAPPLPWPRRQRHSPGHPVMYTRRIRHTVLTNMKHARTHHGRAFLPRKFGRNSSTTTRRIKHMVLTSMKHTRTHHGRALLPRKFGRNSSTTTRRIKHMVLTSMKHARTHHGRAFLPQNLEYHCDRQAEAEEFPPRS